MDVIYTEIFILLCYTCTVLNKVNGDPQMDTIETKIEILELKFTTQQLEISQLKRELKRERNERAELAAQLGNLMDTGKASGFVNITENTLPCVLGVKNDIKDEIMAAKFVKKLLKAFNSEKTKRIELQNKLEFFKTAEDVLNEKLKENVKEIITKNTVQDMELEKVINLFEKQHLDISDKMLAQQTDIETLKVDSTNAKGKYERLGSSVSDNAIVLTKLKKNITTISNNLSEIVKAQTLSSNRHVAFSVRISSPVQDLNAWQVLVFKTILTNVGNGYSPETGQFTTPTNGVYVFFAHVMGTNNKALEMCLRVNNVNKMYMYANGSGHGRDANMVVLKLNVRDKVTVNKHGPWEVGHFTFIHGVHFLDFYFSPPISTL